VFCEKYGKLARTDLKNERISRSGNPLIQEASRHVMK
jgi:hypothetical protein